LGQVSDRSSACYLRWLGQAGFRVDWPGGSLLIDPFVSDHPLRRYPFENRSEVTADVDWVLITHEHADHLDVGLVSGLAASSRQFGLVIPEPLAAQVKAIAPGAHVHSVRPGDTAQLDAAVTVEAVTACHAVEIADGYSDRPPDGPVRYVGYLMNLPGVCIYHAGDTIVSDQLISSLRGKRIDVALLPVNGRDYFRERQGIVGNMNAREAVQLAEALGARVLIPMHWDLVEGNTARPSAVVDEAEAIHARAHILVLARLARWRIA
jgi:L-ascorbate 6-phosphate lactonase